MKDQDNSNTQWIEEMWSDFYGFLEKKDFRNARALLESVGENGFENDALSMHKKINSAQLPELNLSTAEGVHSFMQKVNKAIYGV